MKIFETHAHYDDKIFDEDREEILDSMKEQGVGYVVNIGCSMENSREQASFIKPYDFMYGTVGVHPECIKGLSLKDMEELEGLAQRDKIVGIGEIGLDYHYEDFDKDEQKKWFVRQLDVARKTHLPVVVHSRDAASDTLDIMKAEKAEDIGGVIHCFSYGVEMARQYLNMGYFIGVGGVVTFKNGRKLKEVVSYAPIEQMVLETDAPYLAPVPFRGKRNNSAYLTYVAQEIANIKGMDVEEVYRITYENGKKLYRMND